MSQTPTPNSSSRNSRAGDRSSARSRSRPRMCGSNFLYRIEELSPPLLSEKPVENWGLRPRIFAGLAARRRGESRKNGLVTTALLLPKLSQITRSLAFLLDILDMTTSTQHRSFLFFLPLAQQVALLKDDWLEAV